MKIKLEIEIDNCDDCPFLQYLDYADNCVLSDESINYPKAYSMIPNNCPLKNLDRIKYSVVEVV